MEFNPSKCQVVQVTGSRSQSSSITLHGHVLETVTCAKYLGDGGGGGLGEAGGGGVDVSSGLT